MYRNENKNLSKANIYSSSLTLLTLKHTHLPFPLIPNHHQLPTTFVLLSISVSAAAAQRFESCCRVTFTSEKV